jgi:hypothetical protein
MLNLGPISSWASHTGETGIGVYLLTGYAEQVGVSGKACLKLTLEDADGRATGFAWPESRSSVMCSATPAPVSVTGTVHQFNDHAQIKVHALAPIDPEQVPSATALLPRRRCPEAALVALDRLAQWEQSLPCPLDGFLRHVLLDPRIGVPFLRCRASVSHHHAFVGGLLVHSTERLDEAFEVTQRTLPNDAWSPWIAQMGYLLHDLGKLKSVGELRRPRYALVMPHELATIEMLAPHLAWLEQRDIRLAMALRNVFAYLAMPAASRKLPEYEVAGIVATLDRWSAASHNHRDITHLLDGYRTARALHRSPHHAAGYGQPAPSHHYGRAFRA